MKSGASTARGTKTRLEAAGGLGAMPHNPAPHLTDWMFEIGPTGPDGGAIGWRDITAWQDITGIVLEAWEARLIRRLSADYASMKFKAEKADCPAPYALVTAEAQDKVVAQFKAMVAAMKGRAQTGVRQ